MRCITGLFALVFLALTPGALLSQQRNQQEAFRQWRDLRMGLFVHWGPSSGKGLAHSHSHGRKSALNPHGDVPANVYDTFYRSFNPVHYDPDKWLKLAYQAGMRYTVFVAKHHDGFCMFDTKATDYNIMKTPYGKDVAKLFAEACRRQGLALGWQISPKDWKHPDYNTVNHERYNSFYLGLLDELTGNYGPVSVLWFDGIEPVPMDKWKRLTREVPARVYARNPKIMLGIHGAVKEDFLSFEIMVGPFDRKAPWETCEAINPSGWVYNKPMPPYPFRDLLRNLVYTISRDGNYLLDVGPMEDGNLYPPDAERLQQFADWMTTNKEAVHESRGGPYRDGEWGAATCKGNFVYLFVSDKVDTLLTLPLLPAKIRELKRLDGQPVSWSSRGKELALRFHDRVSGTKPIFTVVRMELDRTAFDLPIVDGQENLATVQNTTSSALKENKNTSYSPANLFDNLGETAWEAALEDSVSSLFVDFGSAKPISSLSVSEKGQTVEWNHSYGLKLSVRGSANDAWRTILQRRGVLGSPPVLSFDEVKARFVKIDVVKKAGQALQVAELRLMAPVNTSQ
ncbi:alpha-L-fucosidase [Flavitalea antarctica]